MIRITLFHTYGDGEIEVTGDKYTLLLDMQKTGLTLNFAQEQPDGTWTGSFSGIKNLRTDGIPESVQGVVEDILLIKGASE